MLIDRKYKLHLVAPKENTRYAINGINFNAERQRIEATNGRAAVMVPVTECAEDKSGIIPGEIYEIVMTDKPEDCNCDCEACEEHEPRRPRHERIVIQDDKAAVVSLGGEFGLVTGTFPKVEEIIPIFKDGEHVTIGLDAKYLYDVAMAMGSRAVSITLSTNKGDQMKPFLIKPAKKHNEARGILMPVALE